ncbi:GNAT family N-acetyltransferase [Mesorhizobium sp. M1396]|uniref:GNAT family N-acetyltransferase n=1 Tax=Mesorhizobium sp. M1396 TaxID=2957095 RepID=UPI00333DAA73
MTESPKINIRSSEIDDLPALSRLIFRTVETSYSGVYPPRAIAFLKQFHSEEKVLQRIETGVTLVAEQGSQLIATASLDGQEITAVFVDPDRQRLGFGQLLMQDLEERARKNGLRETILSVSLPSKKFYERLGYQIVEERIKDLGDGQSLKFWKAKKRLVSPTE